MLHWDHLSVTERFVLETLAKGPRMFLPLIAKHRLVQRALIEPRGEYFQLSLVGRQLMAGRHGLPVVIGRAQRAEVDRAVQLAE